MKLRWAYSFLKRHVFTIRRISHQGQTIPKENKDVKAKFINKVIKILKNLNIQCDDNARIINMEETPIFIEMNYSTTIDFIGKKNVEYLTTGREHYRISIILSVTGDGYKLPPFVIIKGEEGKTIEKKLNELYFVKKK